MKRHTRFKNIKIKWPFFAGGLREYMMKRFFILASIAVILAIAAVLGKAFLHNSSYFRLRTVEVKDALMEKNACYLLTGDLLRSYRGRNIFKIDINEIARSLEASYPDAKRLSVRRVMPDKLAIILNFRKPVAMVSDGRYYPVDEESFILPNIDPRVLKELPTIVGVNIRGEERKGKRSESKNLRTAIQLLKEAHAARYLERYGGIDTIDASDIKELSFYLKNGLEVKIGYEKLKERLMALETTLKDPRLVMERIKYIDVRFESAVIGPKE